MIDLSKSMLDLAVEQFNNSKEPIKFSELWANICETLQLSEEEIRNKLPLFYTSLSMDGRFVVLNEDYWDLKSKHTYEEVHVDINDIYSEDEEDVDEEEAEDDEDIEPKAKKKSSKSDGDDEDEDEEKDEEEDE